MEMEPRHFDLINVERLKYDLWTMTIQDRYGFGLVRFPDRRTLMRRAIFELEALHQICDLGPTIEIIELPLP